MYEVHLNPTYRVPTLWFNMKNLPNGAPEMDLDSVYHYLVPDFLKAQLRDVGVMGGISATVSDSHSKPVIRGQILTYSSTIL